MPKLLVNDAFKHGGRAYRAGTVIVLPGDELQAEIERGKHGITGRWISGVLNHCAPADDETARFLSKTTGEEVAAAVEEDETDSDADAILAARAEFEEVGAAYDNRWGLKRLQQELIKARKVNRNG